MNYYLLIILLFLFSFQLFGQNNDDYLQWDTDRLLQIDDFEIKKSNPNGSPCYGSYLIRYEVNGMDFLTKNFNKKVINLMVTSASWIDTTYKVSQSLEYQQTIFNISEVYTRQLRRDLRANRKKIIRGLDIVNELYSINAQEFSKRRMEFDEETNQGQDRKELLRWLDVINKELQELIEYDYNSY